METLNTDEPCPVVDPHRVAKLMEDHTGHVRALALNVAAGYPSNIDHRLLYAEGLYGLLQAAYKFEDDSPACFWTFAIQRVRGEMTDAIRRMGWIRRINPLKTVSFTDYERQNGRAFDEPGPNGDAAHTVDHHDLHLWAASQLSRKWAEILWLHVECGLNNGEIANIVGLTQGRVSQILRKTRVILRTKMIASEHRS